MNYMYTYHVVYPYGAGADYLIIKRVLVCRAKG